MPGSGPFYRLVLGKFVAQVAPGLSEQPAPGRLPQLNRVGGNRVQLTRIEPSLDWRRAQCGIPPSLAEPATGAGGRRRQRTAITQLKLR